MNTILKYLIVLILGVGVTILLYTFFPNSALDSATRDHSSAKEYRGESGRSVDLAKRLLDGGYLLYFRHAQRQKWDSVIAFDVFELATNTDSATATYRNAVCLTNQGKEEARMIGHILKLAKVRVGHIASSPSCRAEQTAMLAFGRIDSASAGLAHTPVTNTSTSTGFRNELARFLRTVPIKEGTNTAIFAHGNTLENHADLFESGTNYLTINRIQETGFYVIKRDAELKLHIAYKFRNLGNFAAAAVPISEECCKLPK